MDAFSALFGIGRSEIAPTCVLLPYARKNILGWLGVPALSRGKLYRSGRGKDFSVVQTGMGAVFLGDSVLYLAEAGVENFILFSACGMLSPRSESGIGSLLVPLSCSDWGRRQGACPRASALPDPGLLRFLLSCPGARGVAAASVGSLKDVEENPEKMRRAGIEAVDLECAALFAAARETHSRAGALLYATDIPGVRPHYRSWSGEEKSALFEEVRKGAAWLKMSIGAKLSA